MCEADPWYPEVEEFLKKWPDAEWGPGHIVFSDFNTDKGCVEYSLHEAEVIKQFMETRLQESLARRKQEFDGEAFYLKQEIEDCWDELNATIDFLKHMLANPPRGHGGICNVCGVEFLTAEGLNGHTCQ